MGLLCMYQAILKNLVTVDVECTEVDRVNQLSDAELLRYWMRKTQFRRSMSLMRNISNLKEIGFQRIIDETSDSTPAVLKTEGKDIPIRVSEKGLSKDEMILIAQNIEKMSKLIKGDERRYQFGVTVYAETFKNVPLNAEDTETLAKMVSPRGKIIIKRE